MILETFMCDTSILKSLWNFKYLLECLTVAWPVSVTRNKGSVIFIDDQNHFKKRKYGQHNFEEPFEFHDFSEIFYCGMARLRNMNFDVFIQCQDTWTILRNKNMGQSLLKKYSKFQKFDAVLCSGMTQIYKH